MNYIAYFMGGPRDLSKQAMRTVSPRIEFAEAPSLKATPESHLKDWENPFPLTRHRYTLRQVFMAGGSTDIAVYIYEGFCS